MASCFFLKYYKCRCFCHFYYSQGSLQKKNYARRAFLKDLALELCTPAIKTPAMNTNITKNSNLRSAMKSCLRNKIVASGQQANSDKKAANKMGSCFIHREAEHIRRKTRAACASCNKPVCAEHSVKISRCNQCN